MELYTKRKQIAAKYSEISSKNKNTMDSSSTHKFAICKGNNSNLIRRVMNTRAKWEEVPSSNTLFRFKWAPVSSQLNFPMLRSTPFKQSVNHLQCHWELTTKNNLFLNLHSLAESHRFNVFDFYPTTFTIDSKSKTALAHFKAYFSMISSLIEDSDGENLVEKINKTYSESKEHKAHCLEARKKVSSFPQMLPTMLVNHNLWMLKPTSCN